MAWEQKVGYDQYRSWFPEEVSKIISDRQIAMHLLGRSPLTVKYPTWHGQVRSFRHVWKTEQEAECFFNKMIQKGQHCTLHKTSVWMLQNEKDTTFKVSLTSLKKLLTQLGMQADENFQEQYTWNIHHEAYPKAPYFGALTLMTIQEDN